MNRFLVFQLYGPFAAWGDVAVGERRPSQERPGRSAVLGLVAGALGIDRADDGAHAALDAGLGLAVWMRALGRPLRDYHTAQAGPTRRKRVYETRRQELSSDDLSTIVSTRDYRVDAHALAALYPRAGLRWPLDAIAGALRHPHFVPCLGRRACPPALPFAPRVLAADNALVAFRAYMAESPTGPVSPSADAVAHLYWDPDVPAGLEPERTLIRRDSPGSRYRRQFRERDECVAAVPAAEAAGAPA